MVNYSEHESGSGSTNTEDDYTLSTMTYAAIDGNFDGIRIGNSDYGQSIGERYEDVSLVDGALYVRQDDNSKLKLFSWASLGYDPEEDEFGPDVAPNRNSENYGGTTYTYELLAARVAATGEVVTNDDNIIENEMVDWENEGPDGLPTFGHAVIWNGGSKKNGPNSTAKTAARTLSNMGRAAVIDEDDHYAWLDEDVEAREEVAGERLRRFKVEREGEEYSFYTPVFIHKKFDERLTIPNGDGQQKSDTSDSSNEASGETQTDSDDGASEADTSGSSGATSGIAAAAAQATSNGSAFPPEVDDIIDYCAEEGITDAEDITGTLSVMANNPDSAITQSMVDKAGEVEIVEEVQERV